MTLKIEQENLKMHGLYDEKPLEADFKSKHILSKLIRRIISFLKRNM